MSSPWVTFVTAQPSASLLGETLPDQDQLPPVLRPLDVGMPGVLKDITPDFVGTELNGLYVERLLSDLVGRLKMCIDIREQARELEIRAANALIDIAYGDATLAATDNLANAMRTLSPKLNQHGVGFKQLKGDWVPIPATPAEWQVAFEAQQSLSAATLRSLEARKARLSEPGNPSNFRERFAFLEQLFNVHLVAVFRRAVVCRDALQEIYEINLGEPSKTSLDLLVLWAQDAAERLDGELDARVVAEVAIALSSTDGNRSSFALLPKATYAAQLAAGRLTFTITDATFQQLGLSKPLLRNVRLQSRPSAAASVSRVWPLRLRVPQREVARGIGETVAALAFDQFRDFDFSQATVQGMHNRSPRGDWEVLLEPKALDGTPLVAKEMENLFLFLRVSCRRL